MCYYNYYYYIIINIIIIIIINICSFTIYSEVMWCMHSPTQMSWININDHTQDRIKAYTGMRALPAAEPALIYAVSC